MENQNQGVQPDQEFTPNNLTSKEVIDEGKHLGKNVVETTLVWTLAGALTNVLRSLIAAFVPKSK